MATLPRKQRQFEQAAAAGLTRRIASRAAVYDISYIGLIPDRYFLYIFVLIDS